MTAPAARFDQRRIGLIVPSTNAVMERDLWRMAPDGVTIVTARMTYDRAFAPLERLDRQLAHLPRALADVASAGVDVAVFGCTSGSFVHGRAWESDFLAELQASTDVPIVLTAQALVAAAEAAGIGRAAVVTPYRRQVAESMVRYLEAFGIETATLVELEGSPPETIPPAEIAKAIRGEAHRDVDGFILACTALRAWEVAGQLEADVGRPIVTSNQAALRLALLTAASGPTHA